MAGLWNSKYVIISGPLPTGHVTWGMCSKLLALKIGLMLL